MEEALPARFIIALLLLVTVGGAAAQQRASPDPQLPASPFSGSPAQPTPPADRPPAIQEATRIGIALGAAQRCGMEARELDAMTQLGFARLRLLARDDALYGQATSVLLQGQRYGAAEMRPPPGGCRVVLPVVSGILGNLMFLITRADPDVPDLKRDTPLENFAAWSGQLAVMASNCGAQDLVVNKGVDLARRYIERGARQLREKEVAEAELSRMMLQAVLERWGDQTQCVKILTEFGMFFGNLDARLQE